MKVIFLSGKIGSGKDLVERLIKKNLPNRTVKTLRFAHKIKELTSEITNTSLWASYNSKKDIPMKKTPFKRIIRIITKFLEDMEIKENYYIDIYYLATQMERMIGKSSLGEFQVFIGNGFRKFFGADVWINHQKKYLKTLDCEVAIIVDGRFKNEAKSFKDGILIRIERKLECRIPYLGGRNPLDISETDLDNFEFDYVLENNGTILELENQIMKILLKKI